MSTYVPTIGLEIHAELKTTTKMFCACMNNPDEVRPNWHTCPVCMGHPGTLPVANRKAITHVLRVGTALSGTLADFSEFDRKNYFYPDIPKGYQISQYQFPLVQQGMLNGVQITRIHLEEDTARSVHSDTESLIDFNRAGVPLMELVTEPVIHDAKSAVSFARELRVLLRYLEASDANLEKGEMRVEANVSVAPEGKRGTKVEVKNLNSFKAVELAIEYEVKRQVETLEKGRVVVQETRGWDDARQKTFSQRLKEESHDYRYFPEPDLPKLKLSGVLGLSGAALCETLPELPWERRKRYTRELAISPASLETLVQDTELVRFFEQVCKMLPSTSWKAAANYTTTDLLGNLHSAAYTGRQLDELSPNEFAELIQLIVAGKLSSRGGKDVLTIWLHEAGGVLQIAEREGLMQKSDTNEITKLVLDILSEHTVVVDEYKNGKESALQFLVGQAMKRSKGSANPALLQRVFKEQLSVDESVL